ncbi:MAG TPA: hypothetical protein VEW03_15650 [Longimicrobiaceae bacterium]|nr:hypothetical protein [Longimicrobiaceae bacterium]
MATPLLGAALCVPLGRAPQDTVAGTYEIRACAEPCDPRSSPEVVGTLVLARTPFPLEGLPERVKRYLRQHEEWLLVALEDSEPNACFALTRSREAPPAFLGASPVGVTEWEMENDTLSLLLFVTPDAGYVARFAVDGPELIGRGYSYAPGVAYHATRDVIVASRRGPPALDQCFRGD